MDILSCRVLGLDCSNQDRATGLMLQVVQLMNIFRSSDVGDDVGDGEARVCRSVAVSWGINQSTVKYLQYPKLIANWMGHCAIARKAPHKSRCLASCRT
jgi:hypothetical protein